MATILLVEDDERTRGILRHRLESMGHRVVEAPDGQEALKLYRAMPADVVLTDLVMPNKTGLELIEELRRDYGTARVIIMSGVPEQAARVRNSVGDARLRVLSKPFTTAQVRAVIDAELADLPAPPSFAARVRDFFRRWIH